MARGHRFLEHTSDVYVEAYGDDLISAFEEGGVALFEVIVADLSSVVPSEERTVEASGIDMQSLLYDWLEKLLLLFEIERFVGSEIVIEEMRSSGDFWLRARVRGERYDERRHRPGINVKSPTYWLMEIGRRDGEEYIRYVLDI